MTGTGPDLQLPLIIVGAGGHARVLIDALTKLRRQILFLTDREQSLQGRQVCGIPVRNDEEVLSLKPSEVLLVNAVGSIASLEARRTVYQRFAEQGYRFATVIHPAAEIATGTFIEEGAQIMAGAVVQTGTRIGANAIINTRASIDHDCVIGAHVHVAPGVTLSGNVRIGANTHVGVGAVVIQGITIGRGSLLAAGAVVVRDVPDGERVAGVPARPLKARAAIETVPARPGNVFTVMLSAAGRRAALLRIIRQAIHDLGLTPRIVTTDVNRVGAAFHLGDERRLVPRYSDPGCLSAILQVCRELNVNLVVPTIDPDLPFFAEHKPAFAKIGTQIMVSCSQTVRICNDKQLTHALLQQHGVPTIRQVNRRSFVPSEWKFPVFVKPRAGSSSIGARVVQSIEELNWLTGDADFVVEEVAAGREYTVDVYVDDSGKCRCAVPRLRIETRGGEVTKALTVRLAILEDTARRAVECLPRPVGAMNVQIFYDGRQQISVSEINARFGGGYPLTDRAGAPMARWMIETAIGRQPQIDCSQWVDGLAMLRFDDALFVSAEEAGVSDLHPSRSDNDPSSRSV